MFTDLLALASDQGMIVGLRVQPGTPSTFQVHLWVGPSLGERMEWNMEFSAERDRMVAVDEVALRVIACCRDGVGHIAVDRAFAWGDRVPAR